MYKNTIRIVALGIFASCLADLALNAAQYLPIVLVHGILSDAYYMKPVEKFIHQYMGNDVYVKNIELGKGISTSLINMDHQVDLLHNAIAQDPNLANGFNFIAHSQGTLVARAYIERFNNPRVFTYIAFGGPEQGVFGVPGDFDTRFKFLDYLERLQHHILYSHIMQRFVSLAGYWHDSLHHDTYYAKCQFLPVLNNEVDHSQNGQFKANICSLTNMVLVKSDNDDVIEPVISCHFGFYKKGSQTEQETLFESDLYQQDNLGLRTLNESGRLHLLTAHCSHTGFQKDRDNFIKNALPFLIINPIQNDA